MEINKFQNQLYDDLVRSMEESRVFVANTANKIISFMNWMCNTVKLISIFGIFLK